MENFTANSRFIQTSENALIPSMKSLPEETEIEPFSMKFFIKMIRLEELIYSNDMDQQTLGDLLSLYAVLIILLVLFSCTSSNYS